MSYLFAFHTVHGGLKTWILKWFASKTNRDHSVLRLQLSTAFWTRVDHKGYLITSKGFLPTGVDIMVILNKFSPSGPF